MAKGQQQHAAALGHVTKWTTSFIFEEKSFHFCCVAAQLVGDTRFSFRVSCQIVYLCQNKRYRTDLGPTGLEHKNGCFHQKELCSRSTVAYDSDITGAASIACCSSTNTACLQRVLRTHDDTMCTCHSRTTAQLNRILVFWGFDFDMRHSWCWKRYELCRPYGICAPPSKNRTRRLITEENLPSRQRKNRPLVCHRVHLITKNEHNSSRKCPKMVDGQHKLKKSRKSNEIRGKNFRMTPPSKTNSIRMRSFHYRTAPPYHEALINVCDINYCDYGIKAHLFVVS